VNEGNFCRSLNFDRAGCVTRSFFGLLGDVLWTTFLQFIVAHPNLFGSSIAAMLLQRTGLLCHFPRCIRCDCVQGTAPSPKIDIGAGQPEHLNIPSGVPTVRIRLRSPFII
jgi:hypothetical protein